MYTIYIHIHHLKPISFDDISTMFGGAVGVIVVEITMDCSMG
jgi:hypothetical protein